MSPYAEKTSVPVERSRAEVEKTLLRYGATGFAYSWERREAPNVRRISGQGPTIVREYVKIAFKFKERAIQIEVPMPHEVEFGGLPERAKAAQRQRWRALLLVLKAKLEAVESGISSLEAEFLANVLMSDGRTIGEVLVPRLSEAVSSHHLLPDRAEG
jgi:hypothetical protein